MRSPSLRPFLLTPAVLALAAFAPQGAAAQDGFLFRPPLISVTLRAGPMMFNTGGDVFDDMMSRLTLEKSDFRTVSFGGDMAFAASNRLDITLSVMRSEVKSNSEFHNWEEIDPVTLDTVGIKQVTRYRTVPLSITARYLLVPRGRRISDLAWLPSRTAPYLGAGVGTTWYKLAQEGDFVDETVDPPPIFFDHFETSGQALTLHALAGVDYWVTGNVGLNAEMRYTHGSATPRESYQGFDKLDLSGAQATLGLSFRW